jgi:hypothetical protein
MRAHHRILPRWRGISASLVLACAPFTAEAVEIPASALAASVDQLRHAVGLWNVTTTQFKEDGSVAQTIEGSYQFEWVVPDRVVSGRSSIPALGQAGGGETRTTPATPLADGRKMQLRFTRYNVEPDRFESRMEMSFDGGESWRPGNHRCFVRASGEATGAAGLRYRKRSQIYVPLT